MRDVISASDKFLHARWLKNVQERVMFARNTVHIRCFTKPDRCLHTQFEQTTELDPGIMLEEM